MILDFLRITCVVFDRFCGGMGGHGRPVCLACFGRASRVAVIRRLLR